MELFWQRSDWKFVTQPSRKNDNFSVASLSSLLPCEWLGLLEAQRHSHFLLACRQGAPRLTPALSAAGRKIFSKFRLFDLGIFFFHLQISLLAWLHNCPQRNQADGGLSPLHCIVRYKLLQIFSYFYGLRHQQPQRKYALFDQVLTCVLN